MRVLLVLISAATLFLAGCVNVVPSAPSYYAYGNAYRRLEKNVTTFDDVKEMYGECDYKEPMIDGYRCVWRHSSTVVRSAETSGEQPAADFDQGSNQRNFTRKITYTSILTAVFTADNVLKNFTVRNFIEK